MSLIEHKNWHATINQMPTTEGPGIKIDGTLILSSSAIDASLAVSSIQDKSFGLRLELTLQQNSKGLAVLTEKSVSLSLPGHLSTTHVNIFHDGEELTQIDNVETVD